MITTLSDYIAQNGDREIDSEKLDEVLQIKRSKVWKPKHGEPIWYVNLNGDICSEVFDETDMYYQEMWEMGVVFQTTKEANKYVEFLQTRTALKRYANEHNEGKVDWNDFSSSKFRIKYDCRMNKFLFECTVTGKSNNIYFTSEGIAKAAIKEIGEERIKQYLLYEG